MCKKSTKPSHHFAIIKIILLYQNTNQKIAEAYGKWFPRVVSDETIGLEELAAHMARDSDPSIKTGIEKSTDSERN